MSQLIYGSDILRDVLFRAGESPNLTGIISDYLDAAKKHIQRVYQDILSYAPWPWALKHPPGVLNISKALTNTVTFTQGSQSATLGSSVSSSLAGWFICLADRQIPYRIASHTGGSTSITLDAAYKEDSVTGVNCKIFKDEYALPSDCLKIWSAWDRNNPETEIEIINPDEMRRLHPSRLVSGSRISKITVIREGYIRIYPWPEENDITIEFEYTAKPTTSLTFDGTASDIPLIPAVDRHVIADSALVLLMIDKNDARASDISAIVAEKLSMMQNTYINPGRARLFVKRGQGIWC